MTTKLLLLTLISVSLSAFAQIAFKAGMSASKVAAALAGGGSHVAMILAVATSPYVIVGLGLYASGAVLWLAVLSRVDVSMAYPFVGLSFLLTTAIAALLLGEEVGPTRLIGTGMIAAGVCLVAQS